MKDPAGVNKTAQLLTQDTGNAPFETDANHAPMKHTAPRVSKHACSCALVRHVFSLTASSSSAVLTRIFFALFSARLFPEPQA